MIVIPSALNQGKSVYPVHFIVKALRKSLLLTSTFTMSIFNTNEHQHHNLFDFNFDPRC